MNKIGTMRIEQVIGPRLERGGIVVIETQTTSGQVALELSLPVLECLDRALRTAMAAGAAELPSFLAAPMPAGERNVKSGLPRIKKRLSAA
jgi:hypothetical protein